MNFKFVISFTTQFYQKKRNLHVVDIVQKFMWNKSLKAQLTVVLDLRLAGNSNTAQMTSSNVLAGH